MFKNSILGLFVALLVCLPTFAALAEQTQP
jgi:hypothetical protein